ncbi:hypothetical protein [Anaeromicropila populeti]|uniref:Uncharacterized protein n=1 Tax=Anaeromicropila populeti TaxID=37658 RepID=A0A1I6JP09_9FIRM|nr:hypothetical protein [Anaeromicropila populeti]SFR80712.1 hypothetical protein SAMN05661086_01824 [Anaeromicropila populeti]
MTDKEKEKQRREEEERREEGKKKQSRGNMKDCPNNIMRQKKWKRNIIRNFISRIFDIWYTSI